MSEPQTTPCWWCGTIHGVTCPRVKALEYHPDGRVKRVEFFTPEDYPLSVFIPYWNEGGKPA